MSDIDVGVLAPALRAELARRRLLDFGALVYPKFQAPPHIRLLAELLEKVESGAIKKLMVNIPVRHGKSVLCSQIFPAWYIGRNPTKEIILMSHGEDLAVRNSRFAKSLTQDDRWPFDVRLASDSTSAQRWNTTAFGGVFSIGVSGNYTGRGAHVLLVDDPLNDALSASERETTYLRFREVIVPRLNPGASCIVICARFAVDDLCGRVLESEDGPNWHVVNLPALAVEDDPLGRPVGAALWPEHMNVAEINSRRVEMSSFAFSAQFQQDPIPRTGGLIEAEWLSHTYTGMPETTRKVMALDAAAKEGRKNDYSAIAVIGTDERQHYLLDMQRFKVSYPDLKRRLLAAYDEWQPSCLLVEDSSNGLPLIQELKSTTGLPIIAIKPIGSKVSRVESITPLLEAGKVLLPKSASWLDDFLHEALNFGGSASKHDDMVDAFTMALVRLQKNKHVTFNYAALSNRPVPPRSAGNILF